MGILFLIFKKIYSKVRFGHTPGAIDTPHQLGRVADLVIHYSKIARLSP